MCWWQQPYQDTRLPRLNTLTPSLKDERFSLDLKLMPKAPLPRLPTVLVRGIECLVESERVCGYLVRILFLAWCFVGGNSLTSSWRTGTRAQTRLNMETIQLTDIDCTLDSGTDAVWMKGGILWSSVNRCRGGAVGLHVIVKFDRKIIRKWLSTVN